MTKDRRALSQAKPWPVAWRRFRLASSTQAVNAPKRAYWYLAFLPTDQQAGHRIKRAKLYRYQSSTTRAWCDRHLGSWMGSFSSRSKCCLTPNPVALWLRHPLIATFVQYWKSLLKLKATGARALRSTANRSKLPVQTDFWGRRKRDSRCFLTSLFYYGVILLLKWSIEKIKITTFFYWNEKKSRLINKVLNKSRSFTKKSIAPKKH